MVIVSRRSVSGGGSREVCRVLLASRMLITSGRRVVGGLCGDEQITTILGPSCNEGHEIADYDEADGGKRQARCGGACPAGWFVMSGRVVHSETLQGRRAGQGPVGPFVASRIVCQSAEKRKMNAKGE